MTADYFDPPLPRRPPRSRRDIILGGGIVLGAALVLVCIAIVSGRATGAGQGSTDPQSELPTPTGVLWDAEYAGWHCEIDDHHIVMGDDTRVWALDLRDGTTSWAVDIKDDSIGHTCLPDAGLVALSSFRDTGNAAPVDTHLLDAISGEQRWSLPARATTGVLDMGRIIGLVDAQNVLTAVAASDVHTPLWTHQLAPATDVVLGATAEHIDDTFVAVAFFVEGDAEGDDGQVERRIVLRGSDGAMPPWAPDMTRVYTLFDRHDGVTLRWTRVEDEQHLTALDDDGRVLWDMANTQARPIGDRLYLLELSARGGGYSAIRLVDPVTGSTLARVAERLDLVQALPGDRVGLVSTARVISLNSDLAEESREPMGRRIFEFADQDHIFIGDFTRGDWESVAAFTTLGGDVVWETDLVPDQRIHRIGTHLVTIDEDNGVIQGLDGPA